MKIKTDMIEKRQLLFTAVCFLQCVNIHTSIMINVAVQTSWIVLIAAAFTGVISVFLVGGLNKAYGNISLSQMSENGLGRFFGKIISIAYFLFFLWKFCDMLFEFTSFMNDSIMQKTPTWVILLLIVLLCVFAVNSGIAVISSIGFLLMVIVYIISIGSALFLIPKYQLGNFLPLFGESLKNYAEGFAVTAVEPFGELIVFLTVIPYVKNSGGSGKLIKTLLWSVLLGTITFLIDVTRDIGVLGVLAKYFIFPTFESIRMIDIGEIFSRVEIFYAGMLMILAFLKASLWLFAACEMLKSFADRKMRINKPVFCGVVAFIMTLTGNKLLLDSIREKMELNLAVNAIFEYIVPLILLFAGIFVYVRQKNRKKQVAAA